MIFKTANLPEFKQKALQWAAGFDSACYLDSNNFTDPYGKFDVLIAAGVKADIVANTGTAFEQLEQFRKQHSGWMTGFFSYDLKNEIEDLSSAKSSRLRFPDLYFFVPEHLVIIKDSEIEIIANDPEDIFKKISQQVITVNEQSPVLDIQSGMSKTAYLNAVEKIKEHINRGDIYVTNFCQEFFAEQAVIDPLSVFLKLNEISPNPFAAFFKWNGRYILCATPERFLAKRGNKLISQPIKGTAKRGNTVAEDTLLVQELRSHTKELQENVMIVDLVRNDLTRSAKQGTVKTEELYGIYSFRHVHQMISTVVCDQRADVSVIQVIKNTFPMGSMTGAPKISAMRLMDEFEQNSRGVYSGALGYISPNGDFDFNVVIRTILYDQANKHLSFNAGSAITYHADAEKEYEECLLKVQGILEALGQTKSFPPSLH
ncbi:MAG: anthranilate synthase component I family protein [Mucilaginibacter sp.]